MLGVAGQSRSEVRLIGLGSRPGTENTRGRDTEWHLPCLHHARPWVHSDCPGRRAGALLLYPQRPRPRFLPPQLLSLLRGGAPEPWEEVREPGLLEPPSPAAGVVERGALLLPPPLLDPFDPDLLEAMSVCCPAILSCSASNFSSSNIYERVERKVWGGCLEVIAGTA